MFCTSVYASRANILKASLTATITKMAGSDTVQYVECTQSLAVCPFGNTKANACSGKSRTLVQQESVVHEQWTHAG